MTLQYVVNNTSVKKDVRVAFDPPLLGYDEVKPRLIAMTADAQESLGMVGSIILMLSISILIFFKFSD